MLGQAQRQPVNEHLLDRKRRVRCATRSDWPDASLPLKPDERGLLTDWLQRSNATRQWRTLRELAGVARLDLADALLQSLLEWGVIELREARGRDRWEPRELRWLDLPTLQAQLGVESADQMQARRDALGERLAPLCADAVVGEAACALRDLRSSIDVRRRRVELLEALSLWCHQERSGSRRDFAHAARNATKAIQPGEWAWLDAEFDLPALGIEGFAPMFWLAGDLALHGPRSTMQLGAFDWLALPVQSLMALNAAAQAPNRYWLIENRASFERQARRRANGDCIVWTQGRPSEAWLEAVRALLRVAPAPASISADADPAGIEIALAVAAPWQEAGLPWAPQAMEAQHLEAAPRLPLNDYDLQCLQRLGTRDDLPQMLAELAVAIAELGGKAEQEAWL